MRKRIREKISKRLLYWDKILNELFYRGGLKAYRNEIRNVRRFIRYLYRRWPEAYVTAFGTETLDIGHLMAGREE